MAAHQGLVTLENFNDASFDTFKAEIGLFAEFWMFKFDRRWQHKNDRDTLQNFNDASFDKFKAKIGLFSEL